jgi:uncharacterized protein involved in exopolysaccharide biosynthesis
VKKVLLLLFGCGLLALAVLLVPTGLLIAFLQPETFQATARIKVDPTPAERAAVPERTANSPYWIPTEIEVIQSKGNLFQVIINLNLNKKWAEKFKEPGELRTDITYALLKRQLKIRPARNTSLIEIVAYSDDRMDAAQIANEVAKVYLESKSPKGLGKAVDTVPPVQVIDKAEPPFRPINRIPSTLAVYGSVSLLLALAGIVFLVMARKSATRQP